MKKKLSSWGKLYYSVAQAGFFLTNQVVTAWLFYFYTTGGGSGEPFVKPAIVGAVIMAGRALDAFADPIIAKTSDNYKSPQGRRIPFMAFSGIIMIAFFVILFNPLQSSSQLLNTLSMIIVLTIYFISFTTYACPYLALMPELAKTIHERVNLSTYKAITGMMGSGIALIGAGPLANRFGFGIMALIMSSIALILIYIPVFTIKEKDYTESKPATLGLFDAVKSTLRNRPFLLYLVGCVSFWFGGNIVLQSVPFYITVLLGESEGATALYYGAAGAVALLAFPLINHYSKRWGLKTMMMLSMFMLVLIMPFAFFIGTTILNLSPRILTLIGMALAGLPIASLFIVPDALVAAISDLEERNTGQRREAMYYGAQGLIMKIAMGLSTLVMGALFQLFGQTPTSPLGVQLTGPVAAAFVLLGLLIFSRYPEKDVVARERKKDKNNKKQDNS